MLANLPNNKVIQWTLVVIAVLFLFGLVKRVF